MARTVPALLEQRAQSRGTDDALRVEGLGSLTYADWFNRSRACANGLVGEGVLPGHRVVVVAGEDWIEYAVAYVAVQMAGAIAVPVLAKAGPSAWASVARACEAVAVLADSPETVVGADRDVLITSELEAGMPTTPTGREPLAHDDAEILFTSGTTGVPKGVVATHANLTYAPTLRSEGSYRKVLHTLPPASNGGQSLLMQTLADVPHTMLVQRRFDAVGFLDVIETQRPHEVVLAPAFASALLREPGDRDLSSVLMVRTTSAPVTPSTLAALAERFSGAAVVNLYTSTEAWPARSAMRYDPERPSALGRVQDDASVRIVGPDGQDLPAGEAGDVLLHARGGGQRRYYGDAEQAGVFLPGGWVRTGDVGLIDDGYLQLLDRRDDIVNSGGRNVSTLAAQDALSSHPAVEDAAAFGLQHPVLGEYLVAAVTLRAPVEPDVLEAYARDVLGELDAPRRVHIVDELPRNHLGKVLKNELRRDLSARETGAGSHDDDALTSLEQTIAGIWAAVLDVPEERIGARSDWLELGGSSLEAAALTLRIGQELSKRVSEQAVARHGTLREFAAVVEQSPDDDGDGFAPIAVLPRG